MILANGCNITKSEKFKGVWILSVPTVFTLCIKQKQRIRYVATTKERTQFSIQRIYGAWVEVTNLNVK